MASDKSDRLRLTEIFYSLQGESTTVGLPTVFIRLTGCPLRCGYCDTEYAFTGGSYYSIDEILESVEAHGTRYVTVTGGEPLAQRPCLTLLARLCEAGYQVSLETSGAIDVSSVDPRVMKVMDIKTPDSGESDRNLYTNLQYLDDKDQVKYVICSRDDYEWVRANISEHSLEGKNVLLSPSFGQQDPAQLAQWLLEDRLPVRMQLQLHKLLWGDEPGR